MLFLILISFMLGLFFGYRGIFKGLKKFKLVWVTTMILLFVMGFEIGSNKELIDKLPQIGFNALLISIFAIFGGFLFTSIFEKIIKKKFRI